MVHVAGFEPALPCSQSKCATKLRQTWMLEPPAGIEPALAVYKTAVLPLYEEGVEETVGFEPTPGYQPADCFQDSSLKPLGYISIGKEWSG